MPTPFEPNDETIPDQARLDPGQPDPDQPDPDQPNRVRPDTDRTSTDLPSTDRPGRFIRPPWLRRSGPRDRPDAAFDPGLQQERTHLAWERTAVSTMVSGVLLARFAALTGHVLIGLFSLTIVVFGASVLLWAGSHYDDLHSQLRAGQNPAHVAMTRFVGLGAVAATGAALIIVAIVVAER